MRQRVVDGPSSHERGVSSRAVACVYIDVDKRCRQAQ